MRAPSMSLCALLVLISVSDSRAQAFRAMPYNAQLRTDPNVGNVQGIQRYGRSLKTDPDEGEGFSYHVYPVAQDPMSFPQRMAAVQAAGPNQPNSGGDLAIRGGVAAADNAENAVEKLKRLNDERNALKDKLNSGQIVAPDERVKAQLRAGEIDKELQAGLVEAVLQTGAAASAPTPAVVSVNPYPPPFDWTQGIRNSPPAIPQGIPGDLLSPVMRGLAVTRAGVTAETAQIYHQPLIQIRMRVVEVARSDGLAVNSVLEYVSSGGTQDSFTSGNTANNKKQNLRSLSRFEIPDLVTNASTGTGMLVNLTSKHINWLLQAISTEMNADVVTAPEVVTLNGQNVEFVAGEKLPFQLGQNVIQGDANNIQQVFYNTRIVFTVPAQGKDQPAVDLRAVLAHYEGKQAIPFSIQTKILLAVNDYSKRDPDGINFLVSLAQAGVIDASACDRCRSWKPEDCTIDLSIVVRLSEGGAIPASIDNPTLGDSLAEKNVRAVANVIQVRSGHGVVMAGLIGERENQNVAKVPMLGDLPFVGFLFRSKTVARLKTEVLIFLEAQVLDPDPSLARATAAEHFRLGQPFVESDLLDNPLECGMYRVGFGTYLPPDTHGERIFWERFGREIRKVRTHIGDALE
jgi:hypothetical protein